MPMWLHQFLSPYVSLMEIGVWGIAQNLEGLRLFGYLNGIYVDGIPAPLFNMQPQQGVALISLLFTPLLFLTFALNVRAAFHLSNKLGLTVLLAWLLPGVLALCGIVFDYTTLGPDRFEYGAGFPGSVGSATINLFAFLVLGWLLAIIIGSFWNREQFKHLYDHIWYPLAIIAAVYFVTDASLNAYLRDFENANERLTASLTMYSNANKNIAALCQESVEFANHAEPLCKRARGFQFHIDSHLSLKGPVRAKMDNWKVIEVESAEEANELDKAIAFANSWGCGQHPHADTCLRVPLEILQASEDFAAQRYLFPPVIYANATIKYQAALAKYDGRIVSIRETFNLRYFAFLLVAFLAGGKVANSSRAMLSEDVGRPRSWTLAVLRTVWHAIVWICCAGRTLVGKLIKSVWAGWCGRGRFKGT